MPIDLTVTSSPITPAGSLKLTQSEREYLKSFLDRGDRGGYYMALYNLTGNTQCIEQAQIATFSEGSGGVAYAANFMLQKFLPAGYYPGIYFLSQQVAEYSLLATNEKLANNPGNQSTGYITGQEMFSSANDAWKTGWPERDLERYFPGNLLSATLGKISADFQLPPLPDETGVLTAATTLIAELWAGNNLSTTTFLNRAVSEGLVVGLLALTGGKIAGKQLSDYQGDPQRYAIQTTPDGKYAVVTDRQTNKVAGVFNDQLFNLTFTEFLNRAALAAPSILAALVGGVPSGLTVLVITDFLRSALSDFHKSLSESTPGFNGDINPLVPRPNYLNSPLFLLTDGPTAANDTRWGTGGLLNALYGDTLFGGAGDDRMFGGSGDDVLHGNEGADIIYGQSLNDTLYGEDGADVLRGGEGNDTLYGGADDDMLDGEDVVPGTKGNDVLHGGTGNDTLAGGAGNDKLFGEEDNDLLIGGAGNDVLDGGSGNDSLDGGAGGDALLGGQGNDGYTFVGSWGHDTIEDSDGLGVIEAEGVGVVSGAGANKVGDGVWQTDDRRVNYTLIGIDATRDDLIISFSDRADTVRIRSWTNGQLGITLPSAITTAAAPAIDQTVTLINPPGSTGAFADLSWSSLSYLIYGTPDADQVYAGFGNDQVAGNGGGDRLYGNHGDDRLYAGAIIDIQPAMAAAEIAQVASVGSVLEGGRGEDLLIGSASNWLFGGADRDTLIGGGAVDWVQGDTFNAGFAGPGVSVTPNFEYDPVKQKYTYYVTQVSAGVTSYYARNGELDVSGAGDIIVTGAGDDFADGELGDDTLSLGEGSDIGVGGAGADALRGGGGNDLIFGDLNDDASTPTGSEPIQLQLNYAGLAGALHGNDLLMGDEGDDEILGNGGSDQLAGGAGADKLKGDDGITPGQFHGEDFLDGGADDDELEGGGNNDALFGGDGDDGLWGDFGRTNTAMLAYQGEDYLDGEDGDDQLVGGGNDDTLIGGAGDDDLWGDDEQSNLAVAAHGNDELDGGDGDDQLIGGGQNDTLLGGAGNDTLRGDDVVANVAAAAHGADHLDGGAGDDYLYGDGGNDTLIGGAGTDVMQGGAGDDTYILNLGSSPIDAQGFNEVIVDSEGRSTIVFSGVTASSVALGAAGGALAIAFSTTDQVAVVGGVAGNGTYEFDDGSYTSSELIGGFSDTAFSGVDAQGNLHVLGGRNSDQLLGTAGKDTLHGGAGGDWLYGMGGDDLIAGDSGDDELYGGNGDDTLDGGGGNDRLSGWLGNDTFLFGRGDGQDSVMGDGEEPVDRFNTLQFKAGVLPSDLTARALQEHLVLEINGTADAVFVQSFFLYTWWHVGDLSSVQQVRFADGTIWDRAGILAQVYKGTADNDGISGTPADDVINGGVGNDSLYGGQGNDTLDGGADDDSLEGHDGDDKLLGGSGNDLVWGGTGNDTIDGGLGNDTLDGAQGNNTYLFGRGDGQDVIDTYDDTLGKLNTLAFNADVRASDVVVQQVGNTLVLHILGTTDQVTLKDYFREPAYTPVQEVIFADGTAWDAAALRARLFAGTSGDDTINGTPESDSISGGDGNDWILGADGNDELIGGAGNDVLQGGMGDDTYRVAQGDGQDTIIESGGSEDAIVFAAGIATTDVSLKRSGDDLQLKISGGTDQITVQGFFNGDGSEVDFLRFDDGTVWDVAILADLSTRIDGTPASETLVGTATADRIFGYAGDDTLKGLDGDDTLDGGAGNDIMEGGLGNDTYVVNVRTDVVREFANEGIDTVESGVTLTLANEVENLTLTGTRMLNGTGNALDNILIGNGANNALTAGAGNDTIDGRAGNDTMMGGAGNDTYVVDNVGDIVIEMTGGGTDTIESSLSWTLGAKLEKLTLTGTQAIDATGNDLDNTLRGNAGNNRLDGGAGGDRMLGGAGDDTYVVESAGDTTVEAASGGTDTVQSSITWRLGRNVENLTLTGDAAIDATGNALDNLLLGNAANNTLSGGGGADTMLGGAGDDLYVVASVGDVVIENPGEGIDSVNSSVSYTLSDYVENLTLTGSGATRASGNALDNVLISNAGANRLDGGAGADTMIGGAGNDTYVVDNAGDMVSEMADGGTDTIESSLSWTLGAELEKLTLTGTQAIDATGNDLDNTLRGNAGNNRLDGGVGSDRMLGGAGDDIYVVDSTGDTTVEAASGGTDTVQSSITWRLGGNLENLTLTGDAAIDATGNAMDNLLFGNAAANTLAGGAGNDTYAGGEGDDIFTDTSTSSYDTYLWGTGSGLDTLVDSGGGQDHVDLFAGISAAQLVFTRNGNNLELGILGNAADKLTINGWFISSTRQIEEFRLADGSAVLAGQVNALVSAMASFGASASSGLAGPAIGVMQVRPGVDLAMPWAA